MRAVILAGGKGTRLKPYTSTIPKPLVPVGERAILEILIARLVKFGINEATLCLNHSATLIQAFFGDGQRYGLKINYTIEKEPLGTVGPLRLIKNLPKNFLVMNGDLLTDLDFKALYNYHLKEKSILTISTYQRKVKSNFGILSINKKNNYVVGFSEKPEQKLDVCMGVYAVKKEILNFIPRNEHFGFDDLAYKLLAKKQLIKAFPYNGYWLDIGRPEDYEKANEDIATSRLKKIFDC